MNNSDRSHDLTFLFDKEESLLSVLTIVIIFEFHNRKSKEKVLLAFWIASPKWIHTNVRIKFLFCWWSTLVSSAIMWLAKRACGNGWRPSSDKIGPLKNRSALFAGKTWMRLFGTLVSFYAQNERNLCLDFTWVKTYPLAVIVNVFKS